jgi:hypothetical protein
MYAVPDQAGKLARRARDAATAARLWGEAERLTGTALPAGAGSTH